MSSKSLLKLIISILYFIIFVLIFKAIVAISKYISQRNVYKNARDVQSTVTYDKDVKMVVQRATNTPIKRSTNSTKKVTKFAPLAIESSHINSSKFKTFYDYIGKDDFYSKFCKEGMPSMDKEKPYYKSSSPYIVQKSVTKRVEQVSQPKNGYVPISTFKAYQFDDGLSTIAYKNSTDSKLLSPYMGSVVDYVSRYLYSGNLYNSFFATITGIKEYLCSDDGSYPLLSKLNLEELIELYGDFKSKITSIDNLKFNDFSKANLDIIRNIFTIVQADNVLWRFDEPYGMFKKVNNKYQLVFKDNFEIPDYVCKNALICIQRTVSFYKSLKNVRFMEVFVNSELITHGDCDFISNDTIWDLKASYLDPYTNSKSKLWTLQALIYYLMIKDENHHNFNKYTNVKNIGIFNPFSNTAYILDVETIIDKPFIQEIKDEIIGFNWQPEYGLRIDKPTMANNMQELLKSYNLNIRVYSRSFK